jgi:hypothetical protein
VISPIIETIVAEILKNPPDFTILICNILTDEDGDYLLRAVRNNTHLLECSIQIKEDSEDVKILRLIKKAIEFRIQENNFSATTGIKFQFFGGENLLLDGSKLNQNLELAEFNPGE